MLILMKACPRCNGDLHEGSDLYGSYVQCLQCGYIADFKEEPAAVHKTALRGKARRSVESAA